MTISPNFIFVLGGLLLVAIGLAIGVVLFRQKAPDSVEKPVFEALMLIALAMKTIFSEAELEAVAGYIYDQGFATQYYTKEEFLDFVKRVFNLLHVDVAESAKEAVVPAETPQVSDAESVQPTLPDFED